MIVISRIALILLLGFGYFNVINAAPLDASHGLRNGRPYSHFENDER